MLQRTGQFLIRNLNRAQKKSSLKLTFFRHSKYTLCTLIHDSNAFYDPHIKRHGNETPFLLRERQNPSNMTVVQMCERQTESEWAVRSYTWHRFRQWLHRLQPRTRPGPMTSRDKLSPFIFRKACMFEWNGKSYLTHSKSNQCRYKRSNLQP